MSSDITIEAGRRVADFFESSGGDALVTGVRVVVVLVLAFAARAVVHHLIRRVVKGAVHGRVPRGIRPAEGAARPELQPLLTERRKQRADTIGSVLRSAASIMILTIAFTTVMSELGFDLGPVLASAGIVGVAVGFGAQNLVKDFLNGIFMLLEDQYGVGDVIDAGGASGTVEAVGLRVTRIRDVEGVVWHVRNGEIIRIGNKSQGWSRALLDLPVSYDTDVPAVRRLVKSVADGVWRDPLFADKILEEPEVWGVEAIRADGLVIRLVVKTAPLEQWTIARELRQRIKAAFDEAGVALGVPRSVVDNLQPVLTGPGSGHTDLGNDLTHRDEPAEPIDGAGRDGRPGPAAPYGAGSPPGADAGPGAVEPEATVAGTGHAADVAAPPPAAARRRPPASKTTAEAPAKASPAGVGARRSPAKKAPARRVTPRSGPGSTGSGSRA